MSCNPNSQLHRDILVGGFKFGNKIIVKLNGEEEYQALIITTKSGEGLITIKSGQRNIRDEERKALRVKIQRFKLEEPVKVWCKILRATASEDAPNKRVKIESQIYDAIAPVPIPEVEGEALDWQKDWSVEWLVLPEPYQAPPINDSCLQLYVSSEAFKKNNFNFIKKSRTTEVDLNQVIVRAGEEPKSLERTLIDATFEEAIAAKGKTRTRLDEPESQESCNLGEEVEVPISIRGASLTPAQKAIARIVGISAWIP